MSINLNTINRRSFARALLGLPGLLAFGRAEPDEPRYPHYSYAVKKQGDWDLHRLHLPGMEIDMDYTRIVFDQDKGESYFELRVRPTPTEWSSPKSSPTLRVMGSVGSAE